jgi:hypothetical protein
VTSRTRGTYQGHESSVWPMDISWPTARPPCANSTPEHHLRLPESDDYVTIAGLVLERLGSLPHGGEVIETPPERLTVVGVGGKRITHVRIEPHRPLGRAQPTTQRTSMVCLPCRRASRRGFAVSGAGGPATCPHHELTWPKKSELKPIRSAPAARMVGSDRPNCPSVGFVRTSRGRGPAMRRPDLLVRSHSAA